MRSVAAGPGAVRWALGALAAPLVWLERARGRRRLALLLAYTLVVVAVAGWTWRATRLWGLPDIGDPFDVAAPATKAIPEAENAWALYDQAADLIREPGDPRAAKIPAGLYSWDGLNLSDRDWRPWLEANREALLLWRRGAERDRARWLWVDHHSGWGTAESLGLFARLACVEGRRLEQAGDMAGAWGWYNAALRTSRHAGPIDSDYVTPQRAFRDARARAIAWAADPRVDAALLRRALRDAIALDAISTLEADVGEQLYRAAWARLAGDAASFASDPAVWLLNLHHGEMAWYRHFFQEPRLRSYFRRDPERSLRVLRLIFANWRAHRRLDPLGAPALVTPDLVLWDVGPAGPGSACPLTPGELARWFDSAPLVRSASRELSTSLRFFEPLLNQDLAARAGLVVALAEQLYRREHGKPPGSPRELVGPYLDRLPLGFELPRATPQPRVPR
jgi:hypothetical protein